MFAANLAASGTGTDDTLYVDDVFCTYTRTGTGATATLNPGIDMTKGYTLWSKCRSGATDHASYDSARGVTFDLAHTTSAQTTQATGLTAVSTTGHTIGTLAKMNTNGETYVDWVFREADNFHKVALVTKSSGIDATVDLSSLGTVGMVKVKRTDAAGSWYVWHRSLAAGKLLIGDTNAAAATLGHITVVGTTLTLVNGVIADGAYHVEAYAHDASTDGMIQCGSFTTDASGNGAVALGWEPQYVNTKSPTIVNSWYLFDTMRGLGDLSGSAKPLYGHLANAEVDMGGNSIGVTATGFSVASAFQGVASRTFVYLAIRRPNKPPTSGTQVYNAIARTGTGAAATVSTGLNPDLVTVMRRFDGSVGAFFMDKLRGTSKVLGVSGPFSGDEASSGVYLNADDFSFRNTEVVLGTGGIGGYFNYAGMAYINHFFRRAPGVHDQICYTGTGANKTEAHNLTVAPELWLAKGRSGTTQWVWGSSLLASTEKIVMPSPAGKVPDATAWNSTYPTASAISLGTAAAINTSAATYTLYMWATLAGVSKVGTYTGDGAAGKVIDCGFAAGARFVMIIRATVATAQDIFIFDTVRGIVAGNDGHLSLNSIAAEVTTDDSIDPHASGFIVNQVAATNINVSGAVYLYLAYA